MLNPRKSRILKSIIDCYLDNAVPVGSRYLAKTVFENTVSPATIRNDMADMEDDGFLMQPHTSAGRIPTDKGYRYFVDYLMALKSLTKNERAQVEYQLDQWSLRKSEGSRLFMQFTSILAELSKYPSYLITPDSRETRFSNIQLVKIDSRNILVVLVGTENIIEQKVIQLNDDIDQDRLYELSRLLNLHFSGTTISKIREALINKNIINTRDCVMYREILNLIISKINTLLDIEGNSRIITHGMELAIDEPEFQSIKSLQKLIHVFEKKRLLHDILCLTRTGGRLVVKIGRENQDETLSDMSIITAPYFINGNSAGAIGIIGPKRMDYASCVSKVNEISTKISKLFNTGEF
jgi:heat-inducible transcriptional repressor